jgi:hypothetical protein
VACEERRGGRGKRRGESRGKSRGKRRGERRGESRGKRRRGAVIVVALGPHCHITDVRKVVVAALKTAARFLIRSLCRSFPQTGLGSSSSLAAALTKGAIATDYTQDNVRGCRVYQTDNIAVTPSPMVPTVHPAEGSFSRYISMHG